MKKLIFPKNWKEEEPYIKDWKSKEVQKNICPKCHRYTMRFSIDGSCQFCGYNRKRATNGVQLLPGG